MTNRARPFGVFLLGFVTLGPCAWASNPGLHDPADSNIRVADSGTYLRLGRDAPCGPLPEAGIAVVEAPQLGQAGAWFVVPALAGCGPFTTRVNETPERLGVGGATSITPSSPADGTWTLNVLTTSGGASLPLRSELGIRPATGSNWWGVCGTTAGVARALRHFDEATFDSGAIDCGPILPVEAARLDASNYFPGSTANAMDFDADGSGNTGENSCGSRPDKPDSSCASDDDGDGTPNNAEAFFQGQRAPCTGSLGWVQAPSPVFVAGCGGYAVPPGWQGHDQVYVEQTATPKRVWVHDSVCVPAATAHYAPCQGGASNYAANAAPYAGDFRNDGYGWRMTGTVPVLQSVTVDVPESCAGYPRDQDADGVFQVNFCKRTFTITTQGQVTAAPSQAPWVGPLGDVDDANNQVPLPTLIVLDTDGDGAQSGDEVVSGSHPLSPVSRPPSDDDGDGVPNQDEPTGSEFLHSGAYGFVLEHDHYARPPGWTPGNPALFRDAAGNHWVWDAVCAPAWTFDYAACRASGNPGASPVLYTGSFVQDGYGWRNRGPVAFEATVPVHEACDGFPRDQDGDGVPQVAVCRRMVTIHSNGTVVPGPQELVQGGLVDGNDGDAEQPVPFMALHERRREAEALVVSTLDALNATVAEVGRQAGILVNATRDAVGEGVGEVNAVVGLVNDFLNGTRDEALFLIESAQEDAAQVESVLACIGDARDAYVVLVTGAAQAFLGQPDTPHREGLQDALVLGGALFLSALAECDAVGAVAQLVVGAFSAAGEAVVGFAEALNRTVAQVPNPVGTVADVLGDAGDGFGRISDTILSAATDVEGKAVTFATSSLETAGLAVQDFAETDVSGAAASLTEQAGAGQARIEFRAVSPTGVSLGGVLVELFRGETRVRTGNTTPDGSVRFLVEANQTYRYTATKTGFEGAEDAVDAGPAGSTQAVDLVLRPTTGLAGFSLFPLALGASLLFLGVLIGLRIHRR